MSLYVPNAVSLAPYDVAWDGDFWIDRAAAHPGLLYVPQRVESLVAQRPGIEGDFFAPPPIITDCYYASQWSLSCYLTGSGVTLSVQEELLDINLVIAQDWTNRINFRNSGCFYSRFESGDPNPNWIQLTVAIGGLGQMQWAWSDSKWWPGFTASVISRDFGDLETPDSFSSYGIGGFGDTAVPSENISLSVSGHKPAFYLFDTSVGEYTNPVTGSITLTPTRWLDVR